MSDNLKPLKTIYDLEIAPITFDFLTFLVQAECFRQIHELDYVDLTVRAAKYRDITEKDAETSPADKAWRLKGIIADCCELFPTVKNVRIVRESSAVDQEDFDYPPEYRTELIPSKLYPYTLAHVLTLHQAGANPKILVPPERATYLVQAQTVPSYITLTIRTSDFLKYRNVSLDEWYEFYRFLVAQGHTVYVIPDYEDIVAGGKSKDYDWNIFIPACFDLRLRTALYNGALMNFVAITGPATVLIFSDAPYSIFDTMRYEDGVLIDERIQIIERQLGFTTSENVPWAGERQHFNWINSSFETLRAEYEKLELTH